MLLVWLFWLALAVPGLAALSCLHGPDDERMGALEALGLAYLGSFCLLSPFNVVGYWLELPLSWLSGAIAALVAGGLLVLARRRAHWWPIGRPDVVGISGAAVLLVVLYQAAATGAHMDNDADFHLARIRFLRDHGLTNADPFVGTGFLHAYHTNLYHALLAAGSQLTGVDVLELWSDTLAWSKLMLACGIFVLARRLGSSRMGAWIGALLYLAWFWHNDWTLYPNRLGPGWLVPLGLGACVAAVSEDRPRFHLLALGACALVSAQVHGLYAGYLGLLVVLAVVPLTLVRMRRREGRRPALQVAFATLFAVALSAPFLYVAKTQPPAQANFDYDRGPPVRPAHNPNAWVRTLKRNTDGEIYLPFNGATRGPLTLAALLAASALLCIGRPRRMAAFAPAVGGLLAILFTPPLATLLASRLGTAWILERSLGVLQAAYAAVIGAGLSLPLAGVRAARWSMPLLASGTLWIGLNMQGRHESLAYALEQLRKLELDPTADHVDSSVRDDQALLARLIPRGATVLTHPMAARQLAKLYDMRFVRSSRNHDGVPDLMDRTRDMYLLMSARNARSVERLLSRYGIEYAIEYQQHRIRWLEHARPVLGQTPTFKVIRVRPAK